MRRVALAVLVAAAPALAYGPTGHVEASEQVFERMLELPGLEALRRGERDTVRRCFLYGANLPDLKNLVARVPAFQAVKARLEATTGVAAVHLDTSEVEDPGFPTHDPGFTVWCLERARERGDPELLALAAGALAHVCQDRHEQLFAIQQLALAGRTGDLGLGPEVRGHADGWYPQQELELVAEVMREHRQPAARMRVPRSLPRGLAPGGFLGIGRAAASFALRTRLLASYWEWGRAFARERGGESARLVSPRGFFHLVRLQEAASVVIPAVFGQEPLGTTARVLVDEYVDLRWWADALVLVVDALVGSWTTELLAGLLFDPSDRVGPALGEHGAALEQVLWGRVRGGEAWEAALRAHGGRREMRRLLAGGLLDPEKHADLRLSSAMALHQCEHRAASAWTGWPVWEAQRMRGVAAQSFLADPPEARGVIVADLRWLEAGSAIRAVPRGARRVVLEVAFQGVDIDGPAARDGLEVELLVVLDREEPPAPASGTGIEAHALGFGRALEAVLGPTSVLVRPTASPPPLPPLTVQALARQRFRIAAAQLQPLEYGALGLPRLLLPVLLPADPGEGVRGYHAEVRVANQLLFTSDWELVAARGATGPHYAAQYGTYHPWGFASLKLEP